MYEKVAFTVYPVRDVARSRRFYEEVMGLEVGPSYGEGEGAWVEYDLPGGGCFAITNMTGEEPGRGGGTIAFEVSDREALLARLTEADVTIAVAHIPSPVCDMTIVADPDGNSIILHQLKNKS